MVESPSADRKYEGHRKISGRFAVKYFSEILYILFQSILYLRLYPFAIFMGAFVFPLQR